MDDEEDGEDGEEETSCLFWGCRGLLEMVTRRFCASVLFTTLCPSEENLHLLL